MSIGTLTNMLIVLDGTPLCCTSTRIVDMMYNIVSLPPPSLCTTLPHPNKHLPLAEILSYTMA